MTVSDWIGLSVGVGTMLLAAATVWLGYHTRRSANASATSLDAIRAQADATRKQADIAERALNAIVSTASGVNRRQTSTIFKRPAL